MTTTFRLFLAGLLLLAALVAPPAILANVVAGAGGLALLGSISSPVAVASMPGMVPPTFQVAELANAPQVVELKGRAGVVVFKTVDGKLTSRFYRIAA
jgi:hypothetical protein